MIAEYGFVSNVKKNVLIAANCYAVVVPNTMIQPDIAVHAGVVSGLSEIPYPA